MKRAVFILGAIILEILDASASCENIDIDLSLSTFSDIPIQKQIGGACYAYTAANLMTGLIRKKNNKSKDFCSPLEMASNDRLERIRRIPVGSISSDPLHYQLSGGEVCLGLKQALDRGNCCKKFPFEDRLGDPPEVGTSKGLLDGLISWIRSLFGSEDLNSDILADHQKNREKLAPRLRRHNEALHNLRSIIEPAQAMRFRKNGWPEDLKPLVEEFKQKYGVEPFDYDRYLEAIDKIQDREKQLEMLDQMISETRNITSHLSFQSAYSEFMADALLKLSDQKQKGTFIRGIKKEFEGLSIASLIDSLYEIDFELVEQVKKEDQKIAQRILSFFKRNLSDCNNAQMQSIVSVEVIDLIKDVSEIVDQLAPTPIDPSLPPDPLVILHRVIQKSCSPLSESSFPEAYSCESIRRSEFRSEEDPLRLTIDSLKKEIPVGMSFCTYPLFGQNLNTRNDQDSCGGHAVTLIGVRKSKEGRCQVRIRNSWGSQCQQYVSRSPHSSKMECITQGKHAGDLWVDAELVFSRGILQSLEFIQ